MGDIPKLNPAVEKKLMTCLQKEVAAYCKVAKGRKCLLCPFRSLSRAHHMTSHLKYHSAKNMYMADARSPQRAVIRAYFDNTQSLLPLTEIRTGEEQLLQYSALLMKS